jgi:hypothetical protein
LCQVLPMESIKLTIHICLNLMNVCSQTNTKCLLMCWSHFYNMCDYKFYWSNELKSELLMYSKWFNCINLQMRMRKCAWIVQLVGCARKQYNLSESLSSFFMFLSLVSYTFSSMEMVYLNWYIDQLFTTEESAFISWEGNETFLHWSIQLTHDQPFAHEGQIKRGIKWLQATLRL